MAASRASLRRGRVKCNPGCRARPWYARDFDCDEYFHIYRDKEAEAEVEGPSLANLLELPTGSLVLDLPGGWGRLRPGLEGRGYRVVGGDLSPLSLARQAREFPGPAVRLDLRRLPFRDACADGVLCAFTSWGYFASEEENLQQLREYARVLRPGGVLLLDLAGRDFLVKASSLVGREWYDVEGGYRERVRWSPDGCRIYTDRIRDGQRFRHDIWIPTVDEVDRALVAGGFEREALFGGLDGGPFEPLAERWIFRAYRP